MVATSTLNTPCTFLRAKRKDFVRVSDVIAYLLSSILGFSVEGDPNRCIALACYVLAIAK